MKTHTSALLSLALVSPVTAAVVTNAYVQNKATNWSHQAGVTANQTSNNGGTNATNASRAIDGNYSGSWASGSITHTAGSTAIGEYWEVDLGAARIIDDITLFNRTDCCSGRLSHYSVLASNDPTFTTTIFNTGTQTSSVGSSINFSTGGVNARYVRVVRDAQSNHGDNVLSLAEVDVLGQAFSFSNMALGSTPSQSSTLAHGSSPHAGKAIDGDLSDAFTSGSTTHTQDPAPAGPVYWETTFASLTDINEIALYNRGDCCQDRLSNFRLSVYDGGTEVWGQDYFVGTGNAGRIFSVQEDTGGFFARGDRVRIELIGGQGNSSSPVLSLREVEVYGVAVPEPSSSALIGLGGLALLFRRRK